MSSLSVCFLLVLSGASVLSAPSHGESTVIDDSPQARHLFHLADQDFDMFLDRAEFHQVFLNFDLDGNGQVNSTEFVYHWEDQVLGELDQGVTLFLNLDVNNDFIIDEQTDMPHVFRFFDRNQDDQISEGEFVIQWVKIST